MICIDKLTLCRGRRVIIRSLEMTLDRGSILIVRGANGAGKTTLLRGLAGLIPASAGGVAFDGVRFEEDKNSTLKSLIYVGHEHGFSRTLTAFENLRFWGASRGGFVKQENVFEALEKLGVKHLASTPLFMMSQGQSKRCGLARLALDLHESASVWLLDEPFAGLDQQTSQCLTRLIEQHTQLGGVAVLSSHHTLQMARGRVLDLDAYHD